MFLTLIISIILTSAFGLGFGLVGIAIFAVIGAIAVCMRKMFRHANKILIIILVALLATFTTYTVGDNLSKTYSASNAEIVGTVSIDTAYDGEGNVVENKLILDNIICNGDDLPKKAIVYLSYDYDNYLKIGDRITLKGDLSTLEFEFFDSTSARQNRNKLGYVVESPTVTNIEKVDLKITDTIKLAIKSVLYKFSPQSAEVIYAMMFGDKSNMSDYDNAVFSSVGLSHLFAVSGLHIGIIAGAITLVLRKCKLNKYLTVALTTLILILYGALCNFSPSVIRSIIMVVVMQLSVLLGARNDGISSLSLAGVIILLFNPIALFDLSFVMTMLAVYGIACFYKPIVNKMSKIPKWISNSLSLSFAVNITLLPIMLSVFGVASFKFILATIFIMPLASFVFPFLVAIVLIGLIPYIGYLLIPFEYIFIGINYLSLLIAKIPLPIIKFNIDWWISIPYIAIITVASGYCMCKDKLKKAIAGSLTVGIMALATINIVETIKNPSTITTLLVNEYSQAEMIIADGKGYLIVRGGLSHSILRAGINLLYDYDIYEIESIVMDDFNNYDIDVLKDVSKTVKINSICSYCLPNADLSNIVMGNVVKYIYDKKISINFNITANEIYVNTCDVDILFLENANNINVSSVQYEIIFTDGTKTLPAYYADKVVVKDDLIASGDSYSYRLYNGKIKEKLFD